MQRCKYINGTEPNDSNESPESIIPLDTNDFLTPPIEPDRVLKKKSSSRYGRIFDHQRSDSDNISQEPMTILPSYAFLTGVPKNGDVMNVLLLNELGDDKSFSSLLILEDRFILRTNFTCRIEYALTTAINGTIFGVFDTFGIIKPNMFQDKFFTDMRPSIILIFGDATQWLTKLSRIYAHHQALILSYDDDQLSMFEYHPKMDFAGIVYPESRNRVLSSATGLAEQLLIKLAHKHNENTLSDMVEHAVAHSNPSHEEKKRCLIM